MWWRLPFALLAASVGVALVVPVAAVAVGFAAVARFTRTVAAWLERGPRPVPWRELVEYEPVIGWRPRRNLDVHAKGDDVFRVTTGPDGWRGRVPLSEADVVVFGDSFAFGHGADDRHMYTAFCGDLRVKPVGSDGYNMVHCLLWMRRLAPALVGKLVVWFIYYGNDLHENLLPNMGRYRMPYVRRRTAGDGWELVTDHVSPEPWPVPSPTSYHPIMAAFCSATPFSRRVFSACDYLISEAGVLCQDAGSILAVVGVPDRALLTRRGRSRLASLAPEGTAFDRTKPDSELSRICARFAIPFVPLTAHLTARDYLVHDIHWRPSGHRKVGDLVQQLHRQTRGVHIPRSRERRVPAGTDAVAAGSAGRPRR